MEKRGAQKEIKDTNFQAYVHVLVIGVGSIMSTLLAKVVYIAVAAYFADVNNGW